MPELIDHVVIAVRDLDQASADLRRLGFTVTPGGEHGHRRSRNALVSFADSAYLEIIAFKDPDTPQDNPWWRLLSVGEGFVDYAVFTRDLAAEIAALRAAGLDPSGPDDGGRLRPDGQRVDWRVARVASFAGDRLPFVIEDVTPRELRVPGGDAAVHAVGVTGVRGVTSVARDLDATARAYEALLGRPGEPVATDFAGAGPALRYRLGNQWLEIVRPDDDASDVAAFLEHRGPGPYEIVLGAGLSPSRGELQPTDLTHGARLRVAG